MADRSDYLPATRLQDLAKTIDPKLKLEPDAVQVSTRRVAVLEKGLLG